MIQSGNLGSAYIMKINPFFFVAFCCVWGYGQNLQVDYKFSIIDHKDPYGITGFCVERLVTNQSESLTYSKNIDTTVVFKDQKEPHTQEASPFAITCFKAFIVGKRYTRTLFPKYNLKDENYSIAWKISDEGKTILGHQCQKATGSYRGRDYVSYFTTDIPIQNGPGAFDNLPGLVLEVYSTGGVVRYEAFQVKGNAKKIYNVFDADNKQYISWEDFVRAYKNYFTKMIHYKPEEDTTYIVPNRSIEVYFTAIK